MIFSLLIDFEFVLLLAGLFLSVFFLIQSAQSYYCTNEYIPINDQKSCSSLDSDSNSNDFTENGRRRSSSVQPSTSRKLFIAKKFGDTVKKEMLDQEDMNKFTKFSKSE